MALLQIAEPGQSRSPHDRKVALGIDLGTTNSLVAIVRNEAPAILNDLDDYPLIPSVVYYGEDEKVLVGRAALKHVFTDPANTIVSVKRFMGRGIADLPKGVVEYPYAFDLSQENVVGINTRAGLKNAVEISAAVLLHLKRIATARIGKEVKQAVITVPAYFDEAQRQATRQAAKAAGLEVLRLLNEPTAAAIAYGLDTHNEGIFLIYDLGGGTLDVSILRLEQGIFEVVAVSGDTYLGGDDFDHLIHAYLIQKFHLSSLSIEDSALLLRVSRKLKECLSVEDIACCEVTFANGVSFVAEIAQDEFDLIAEGLLKKAEIPIKAVLFDAQIALEEIEEIVLVGGATRMPLLQKRLSQFFNRILLHTIDPDKVVAMGAAIQADILVGNRRDDWLLLDVTPLSLGIETVGGVVEKIIPRNCAIPVRQMQEFTTYKDGQSAMSIHIVQGEREKAIDCRSLAKFSLKGIPPMKSGMARVEIIFQIDADGLLSVAAREVNTGVQAEVTVKPSFGLTEDQVKEMLADSIEYAQEDMEMRQLAEAQTTAGLLIDVVSSALEQDRELLSSQEIEKIIQAVNQVKSAIILQQVGPVKQAEAITEAMQDLNSITEEFAIQRMNRAVVSTLSGKKIDQL